MYYSTQKSFIGLVGCYKDIGRVPLFLFISFFFFFMPLLPFKCFSLEGTETETSVILACPILV